MQLGFIPGRFSNPPSPLSKGYGGGAYAIVVKRNGLSLTAQFYLVMTLRLVQLYVQSPNKSSSTNSSLIKQEENCNFSTSFVTCRIIN
jgi:hypothetical protein